MWKTGVLVGAMAVMALIAAASILALASRTRTYDSIAAFSAAYPEAVVTVSPDGRKAVTQFPYGGMLPIWDADSRRVTTIYAVYGAGDSVAFSPDGRYLVITGAMLRVYDLNVPQSADRGPTYRLPSGEGWRFVSAHTIEIADGVSLRRSIWRRDGWTLQKTDRQLVMLRSAARTISNCLADCVGAGVTAVDAVVLE